MYVEQIYTGCLSEAAYYVESDGEVAIIDPLRDTDQYIELAKTRKAKIKYVFETHFHADFVSGHIDLAAKTNSTIIYGPKADPEYDVHIAKDGERFKLGKVEFEVLHTPGHTPESSCYLLRDQEGKEYALFSGDTLFVGDVGRPDLIDEKISKEDMAGMLYDSLNDRIKPLPVDVILYPAHGPGSACGKNISSETYSTIGEQLKTNYALQDMKREKFIKIITDEQTTPPQYFSYDIEINRKGYKSLDSIIKKNFKPLTVEEFEAEMENSYIIDTREHDVFEQAFIKGSINIGLDGRFAEWMGTLFKPEQLVILVTEVGKEKETIVRMARVGYENVNGFLDGGFASWIKADKGIDVVITIEAQELDLDLKLDKEIAVLDVRKEVEFEEGHILGALNVPLQNLAETIEEATDQPLHKEDKIYVHCQGGYRSMVAASILKKNGFINVKNIKNGYDSIKKSNLPIYSSTPVGSSN
ncbi:MAG: MBL fold metallo-hydrolase [Bacteroidetes bacterium]|nr:MBL fold metallo-hydrolase [Bacteroidota bacterium]